MTRQNLRWTVGRDQYLSKTVPPGTYSYCYSVRVIGDSSVADTFCIDITFVDPCVNPAIVEPASGTMSYTITNPLASQLSLSPKYAIDPDWCRYSIEMLPPVQLVNLLDFNPTVQVITLSPILDDLALAGLTENTYTVKTRISFFNFANQLQVQEVDHFVKIRNPCAIGANVSINLPSTLGSSEYVVETGPLQLSPVAANQQDLVNAVPTDHELCGAITCIGTYNALANDIDQNVMTWDMSTLAWTVNTSDRTLISKTRTYQLVCEFATYPKSQYPNAPSDSSIGQVIFKNACLQNSEFQTTT